MAQESENFPSASITLTLNGQPRTVRVATSRLLIDFLREDCELTGTKLGCGVGVCGACTVLVDGLPASSCLMLVVQVSHKHVQTIEWLADQANIQPLKEAFAESGGFQCGYCTSGQLTALAALVLAGTLSDYSDEQLAYYMMGNLCRCTGYYGILRAARSTIKELAEVRGERRADV